jgi:hypothetical protein
MVGAITPVQANLRGRGPKQARDAKERQRGTGGDHHKKAVVETLPQPDGKRARDVYDLQVKVRQKLSKGRRQKGKETFPDLNDYRQARDVYGRQAKERRLAMLKKGDKAPDVETIPPRENKKARDAAGEAVRVSGRSVDFASKVLKNGDSGTAPGRANTCGKFATSVSVRARDVCDKAAKERQKRKPEDSVVETVPQQNNTGARDAAGTAILMRLVDDVIAVMDGAL